ncbi:MAG: dTDP-4-dehydrorhamnose reductase [Firmicutes bacterium]|jgi:dTDP-4-dehydrorhamnose reductase|nr:dTDP-4-dehydrorhamnose reductase [Bacillota bacterium]
MRILVTGAGGQLGKDIVLALEKHNSVLKENLKIDFLGLDRGQLDVSVRDQVFKVCYGYEPDVIIHAAAWTKVDECESDLDKSYSINALGTRYLADAAKYLGAYFLYVSTDYVFDGTKDSPYLEWDRPNPLSVYGKSKLAGEEAVFGIPFHCVVRTSWVCGYGGANMVKTVLRLLAERDELQFVDDQIGSPTFTEDLADKIIELALGRFTGIFHVTNSGVTSWYGLAREIAALAGYDESKVLPIKTAELYPPRPAPRPANSVLDNMGLRLSDLALLPDWHLSLDKLLRQLKSQ